MTNPKSARLSPDEIELLAKFVSHELTESKSDEVVARLATDPAFFEKAYPLVMPPSRELDLRALLERGDREAAAQARPLRRPRKLPAWALRHPLFTVFAVFALIFGEPVSRQFMYAMTAGYANDLAKHKSTGPDPELGEYVETGHDESRTVTLPGGSTVQLAPMSRLTWRNKKNWPGGVIATLKGEALIEVSDADGVMYVGTPAGGAVMLPGNYGLRCELGCITLKVTVGLIGKLWIKGTTGTQWTFWPLGSREHGWVRQYIDPQKSAGGEGYPVVP